MEYQNIINLLKHTPNQSSKFRAKSWVEINDNVCETNYTNNQIKFKTTIFQGKCNTSRLKKLRSNIKLLCTIY